MSAQPAAGFVPATREQSLRKILAYAKKNAFAVEELRSDNGRRRCAVGCLFSTRQLNDLNRRGLLSMSISEIAKQIGDHNLLFVTGMPDSELMELARLNDNEGRQAVLKYVKDELAKIEKAKAGTDRGIAS